MAESSTTTTLDHQVSPRLSHYDESVGCRTFYPPMLSSSSVSVARTDMNGLQVDLLCQGLTALVLKPLWQH